MTRGRLEPSAGPVPSVGKGSSQKSDVRTVSDVMVLRQTSEGKPDPRPDPVTLSPPSPEVA